MGGCGELPPPTAPHRPQGERRPCSEATALTCLLPHAAYLCPDSVLVAEDGAVLFGLPPANGGYGARAPGGSAPALPLTSRPDHSAGGRGLLRQALTTRSSWLRRWQSRSW